MRFVLRRLGFFVLTLWAALTLNFFIPRFMPGSPLQALRDRTHNKLSPAALEQMLTSYGFKPHQNIVQQYFEYLQNMVTGRWGISIGATLGEPVTTIVTQALPWTLGLVGVATILAFLLGSLIGIVAGWKRGGKLDSILPPVFVVTSALPYFWVGLLLILVFSVWTNGFLPSDFNYDNDLQPAWSPAFIGSVLTHAILPAATILITSIGGWILTMRNNMITTLAEDYVRMGRAKGLSNRRIMYGYAARNAFLPNLSGFAMSLGFVISGAILVEYVFNYPGLGYLLLQRRAEHRLPADAGAVHAVHGGRAGRGADLRLRDRLARSARPGEGVDRDDRTCSSTQPRTTGRARRPAVAAAAGRLCAAGPDQPQGHRRPDHLPDLLCARRGTGAVHVRAAPERHRLPALAPSVGAPLARHHLARSGHLGPTRLRHPAVAGHRAGRRAVRDGAVGAGRRLGRLPRRDRRRRAVDDHQRSSWSSRRSR